MPVDAEVSSNGVSRWQENHLLFQLMLERKRDGNLAWTLIVGDAKFGPALKNYGYMSILVRLIGNPSIPWPTGSADQEFARFFLDGVAEARAFVSGRADLAGIFASDTDVCRGSVYAWLPPANYISRLIESLIIARDIGDDEFAGDILGRLHSGVQVPSYDRDVDILVMARELAKPFSKALGFQVEL
jgi:hypothetical protein